MLRVLAAATAAVVVMVLVSYTHVHAASHPPGEKPPAAQPLAQPSADPSPDPSPSPSAPPPARSFATLQSALQNAGTHVGVALIELGGTAPQSYGFGADDSFAAASTYKLPLLMAEAQGIGTGTLGRNDRLCYDSSDYEDGWFDDYDDGSCFTRETLLERVGLQSDNTAAHILVRYLGGGDALNEYARSHGAVESDFWVPNTTTAADLARLWQNEMAGSAGGTAAENALFPWMTHTAYEDGIPAGLPAGAQVAHKVGEIDAMVADAALVLNGPHGAYVLVVMTDGLGGDAAWQLIAQISTDVWQLETAR
jgi:beta-lactamase class A